MAGCGVEVQQQSSDLQEGTNLARVEYCLFAVKPRGTGTSALTAVPRPREAGRPALSERFGENGEVKG